MGQLGSRRDSENDPPCALESQHDHCRPQGRVVGDRSFTSTPLGQSKHLDEKNGEEDE